MPGGLRQTAFLLCVRGVVGVRADALGYRPSGATGASAGGGGGPLDDCPHFRRGRRRVDYRQCEAAYGGLAGVLGRGWGAVLIKNPLSLARGLAKPAFQR